MAKKKGKHEKVVIPVEFIDGEATTTEVQVNESYIEDDGDQLSHMSGQMLKEFYPVDEHGDRLRETLKVGGEPQYIDGGREKYKTVSAADILGAMLRVYVPQEVQHKVLESLGLIDQVLFKTRTGGFYTNKELAVVNDVLLMYAQGRGNIVYQILQFINGSKL